MSKSFFKNIYLGSDTSGQDISDRVTYLQFAQSIRQDDSLEFFAEGDDAAFLLEQDGINNGRPVVFNFGYIGAEVSPSYKAVISDIEATYDADSGLKVSVKCGDRGRTMRKARSKKVWKRKTTDQIFKEIAQMHGLNTYIEIPVGGFIEWASLPQGSLTNMDFLQMLTKWEKDGSYICFITGDDLHLVRRNVDGISQNKIIAGQHGNLNSLTFKWRETTASGAANEVGSGTSKLNAATVKDNVILGETGIYTASGAVWFQGKDGKRSLLVSEDGRQAAAFEKVFGNSQNFDAFYKQAVAPKSNNPQPSKRVGNSLVVPVKAPTITNALESALATNGSELISPDSQDGVITANLASAMHKDAVLKVLTAEMKEFGDPNRKIHTVITLGGVATRFAGNWLIETVSHEVGPNSYMTTSEMVKNGTKKGGVKAGSTNTKIGDDSDDSVFIGLKGADNGKAYSKDSATGVKKEIEYTPHR